MHAHAKPTRTGKFQALYQVKKGLLSAREARATTPSRKIAAHGDACFTSQQKASHLFLLSLSKKRPRGSLP